MGAEREREVSGALEFPWAPRAASDLNAVGYIYCVRARMVSGESRGCVWYRYRRVLGLFLSSLFFRGGCRLGYFVLSVSCSVILYY